MEGERLHGMDGHETIETYSPTRRRVSRRLFIRYGALTAAAVPLAVA
jgi:hypothetical protein